MMVAYPFLIFLSVCSMSVLADSQHVQPVYQPYGPLMCTDTCGNTSPLYTWDSLSCSCEHLHINLIRTICTNLNKTDINQHTTTADHQSHKVFAPTCEPNKLAMCPPILRSVCRGGCLGKAKELIHKPSDVNCRTKNTANTPIMIVVTNGNKPFYDFLVGKGPEFCYTNTKGQNILHVAIMGGHAGIVEDILGRKIIDVNKRRGRTGNTPLELAVKEKKIAIFDLLVEHGADVTILDWQRRNILHHVCREKDNDGLLKHILRMDIGGLDLCLEDRIGYTPVMLAADRCFHGMVEILKKAGCHVKSGTRMNYKLRC